MKKLIFFIVSIFSIFMASGQTPSVIIDNSNYKGVIFSAEIKLRPIDTVRRWTPSENDIQMLEKELKTFFQSEIKKHPEDKDRKVIYQNLKNYLRQYAGYIAPGGQKIIFINFLWNKGNDDFNKGWQNRLIIPFDGGTQYWRICYNLNDRKLFGFEVNGVA